MNHNDMFNFALWRIGSVGMPQHMREQVTKALMAKSFAYLMRELSLQDFHTFTLQIHTALDALSPPDEHIFATERTESQEF